MADHPNIDRIRVGYEAFFKGDFAALDDFLDENVVWHEDGRNQFAGTYNGRNEVYSFFGRLMESTGGTFNLEVHSILADDDHGVALVNASGSRDGGTMASHGVHVMHLRDGRVAEFWAASTNQYAVDDLFG